MLKIIVFFGIPFCFSFCIGLEYNKQQRHNANSDFLLHESNGNPSEQKWDSTASQQSSNSRKQDYISQFPSLATSTLSPKSNVMTSAGTTIQSQSGKRDYVASEQSKFSSNNSGKRDYVSQFPSLVTPTLPPKQNAMTTGTTLPSQSHLSTGKRDYVAASRNPSQSTSNVKDLVNFYDSKSKDQNTPSKMPSYSSILQGSKNNPTSVTASVGTTRLQQPITQPTVPPSTGSPTKPSSFSSVVSGSTTTKSTTPHYNTANYNKHKPNSSPTPRPGTVMPSSILNNQNKNNQGNNNGPSDKELQTISEELLRKDTNNAAKYITINYQGKTTSYSSEDKAPQHLLTVAPEAWNIPTVQKFIPLLDNYERDTFINEYVTPQERNEENAFMDSIMSTSVIRHLMNFLKDKGYVTPDPKQQRDFLKQLWFSLYSRGKGKLSSSGFEHVFVSELRNGDVLGLHNWIYFSREESANRANYLGYLKYLQLNDKGVVMKLHFNQQGADKPVNSMLIGTSPELEIALYTLCFVTRADNDCKLKLANKDVDIVTHTFRYRSKNLIGSAYPQI